MKPKTRAIDILLMCFIMIIISCRKNTGNLPALASGPVNEDSAGIAAITREVAEILMQVYKNEKAYREVNAAIFCGYYEDERVLLRDLLFPETSDLYRMESFKKFNVDTGSFRRAFCEILDWGDFPLLRSGFLHLGRNTSMPSSAVVSSDARLPSRGIRPPVLVQTKVVSSLAIYFPYAENFSDVQTVGLPEAGATIVRPTGDTDVGIGMQPFNCHNQINNLCYRSVTVDDAYAERHPTHIIGMGAQKKQTVTYNRTEEAPVSRAYHGWSRLTRQMDRLISLTGNGGGSEIKIARITAYLKLSDEQVTGFSGDVVTVYYTRADIRKKRWKRIYSVWDPNWNYQDVEQVYAVYEDDTKGSATFDGSLKTTINLPDKLGKVEGDIGYKIQVSTQDQIITQKTLDRKSFLRDGAANQGWGFISDANDFLQPGKDWPVYDGGTIWQFTMPFKDY